MVKDRFAEIYTAALNETLHSSDDRVGTFVSKIVLPEYLMPAPVENGIIDIRSPYPVSETVTRLESVRTSLGLSIFASIEHSGEARRENESDPADYFGESEERHSGYDCRSD